MSDTIALIVALIRDNPAGIRKLLAEHVDDGTGHCRRCHLPGQRGFDSWPCIHHIAATLAIAAAGESPVDRIPRPGA